MQGLGLEGIHKVYGGLDIVKDLSLDVPQGEFIVILGPSGCGKSTLLRMIAGLEDVSAGEIRIDGSPVTHLPPRKRGCAMVFQNYALYPHMTVADNIGYALKVAGVPKAERTRRIAATAESIGLGHLLDRRPGELSGGQRQRVAMGRAIVREPKVFLFDEPLSNLDAKLRVQMRIEIRRLHERLKATSIFVTHDQTEAMTLADRLIVLNAGRVEQEGTPAEVYGRPASLFVAGFVGSPAMNLVEAEAAGPDSVVLAGRALRTSPHGLSQGAPVMAGFRAEDAVLDAAAGGLVMEVDFVEELGAQRLLHGRIGTGEVIVQVPSTDRRGLGPLSFSLAPAAIHLFDRRSGLALPRLAAPTTAAA